MKRLRHVSFPSFSIHFGQESLSASVIRRGVKHMCFWDVLSAQHVFSNVVSNIVPSAPNLLLDEVVCRDGLSQKV